MSNRVRLFSLLLLGLLAFHSANGFEWTSYLPNSDISEIRKVQVIDNKSDAYEVRSAKIDLKERQISGIQFKMVTSSVPRFVLRFFNADFSGAEAFAARWTLWKLFEYKEKDGIAGFSEGDEYISGCKLWSQDWNTFNHSTSTGSDGSKRYRACNTLTGSPSCPSVQICGLLTDRSTTVDGRTAVPDAIKWSLIVDDYNFQDQGTQLALKVSFDAAHATKDLDGGNTTTSLQVDEDDTGARTIATWEDSVEISGSGCGPTSKVIRSSIFDSQLSNDKDADYPSNDPDDLLKLKSRIAYFSFDTSCQPNHIYWDPEFGIATETGSGIFLAPSLLFVTLAGLFYEIFSN